jgi:hypothetical protein
MKRTQTMLSQFYADSGRDIKAAGLKMKAGFQDLALLGKELEQGTATQINRWTYLRYIEQFLKIPPPDRKPAQIARLIEATGFVPYFSDLKKDKINIEFSVHERLCRKLQLESVPSLKVLFHQGDPASKFYIILQGDVIVIGQRIDSQVKKERLALKTVIGKKKNL